MLGSSDNPNSGLERLRAALSVQGVKSGPSGVSLEGQVRDGRTVLEVAGNLKLTKTAAGFTHAIFWRDHALEAQTQKEVEARVGISTLIDRYRTFDSHSSPLHWPQHYPVKIMAAEGGISSGYNVFLFWPGVAGKVAKDISEVLAFEFIDIWKGLFEKAIFPCAERVFDSSLFDAALSLRMNLERTIYLAGVLHELGHQVGSWKCLPTVRHDFKILPRHSDALTELQSDCLLGSLMPEFQELSLFVILSRLFWFGRRGYRSNSTSALLNEDGDCWTGSFMWKRLREMDVIVPGLKGKYTIRTELLTGALAAIAHELQEVGRSSDENPIEASQRVTDWISKSIPSREGVGFVLSEELRNAFRTCEDIVEVPHFVPPYSLSDFKQIHLKPKP